MRTNLFLLTVASLLLPTASPAAIIPLQIAGVLSSVTPGDTVNAAIKPGGGWLLDVWFDDSGLTESGAESVAASTTQTALLGYTTTGLTLEVNDGGFSFLRFELLFLQSATNIDDLGRYVLRAALPETGPSRPATSRGAAASTTSSFPPAFLAARRHKDSSSARRPSLLP